MLDKLIDYVGSLPGKIWNNHESPWYVPYREAFHALGGLSVGLLSSFNLGFHLFAIALTLGLVIYGEFGDIKSGSPKWKSVLDVAVWAGSLLVVTYLRFAV